jgi:hypothetical protein
VEHIPAQPVERGQHHNVDAVEAVEQGRQAGALAIRRRTRLGR